MNLFGYEIRRKSNNTASNLPASTLSYIGVPPVFQGSTETVGTIDTRGKAGQAKAYALCSPLMSVISKKCAAIKNLRLAATTEDGEDIERPDAVRTMSRPNSVQGIADFVAYIEVMTQIFGKAYIVRMESVGFSGAFELFVVPNLCVTENAAISPALSFMPDADIVDYTVTICGSSMKIAKEDMFIVRDASYDLNACGGNISRMVSLQKPVNTFVASYEAVHELMINRGMLAIISLTSGSGDIIRDARLPETESEKKNIQQAFRKYGIRSDQFKYAITSMNAAVSPVSSTITDLGLTDVQKACKKEIADIYQVPSVLLDVEGSTYANAKEAKAILYNDAIIPEANNIFYVLNRIYGFEDFKVMPYYDHLELFQESKREQAAGMTNLVNALNNAVSGGLMTTEQAKTELLKYIV
ncbi:MAG: phage portal protein [Alistipes shahii]